MDLILSTLRQELRARSSAINQKGAKRYFKEAIKSYGIKNAEVHALAKEFGKELKGQPKKMVFLLCEELWKSGIIEEGHVAIDWAFAIRKQFTEADFKLFEKWIGSYITNWANCDGFCNHVVGALLLQHPALLPELQHWARSKNRWLRRASAASLIVPARKGLYLDESFSIAKTLLQDPDDLVQKGYGWLLKEQCKKNEDRVFEFVLAHKKLMPRTALRYAIEKMGEERKKDAMGKG
jgi:3-methyladenine DNA glycosylase AlkD